MSKRKKRLISEFYDSCIDYYKKSFEDTMQNVSDSAKKNDLIKVRLTENTCVYRKGEIVLVHNIKILHLCEEALYKIAGKKDFIICSKCEVIPDKEHIPLFNFYTLRKFPDCKKNKHKIKKQRKLLKAFIEAYQQQHEMWRMSPDIEGIDEILEQYKKAKQYL